MFQISPKAELTGKLLPLESIRLLSVVSKWISPLTNWDMYMEKFNELGYNMVHLTPLQKRGLSNSPYSIHDHLALSNDLQCASFELLKHKIEDIKARHGMLSMIDIVWNHISCDSPYLSKHQDIGYNLENSPHLQNAFDLDEGIMEFSRNITSVYGLDPNVSDENALSTMMKVFLETLIPKLTLWEYFAVDVGMHVHQLEELIRTKPCVIYKRPRSKIDPKSDYNQILRALKNDGKHQRYSNHIDMEMVEQVYHYQLKDICEAPNEIERSIRISRLLSAFRSVLDSINYSLYRNYDEKIAVIIRNIASRVRYERLDPSGPRLGPISSSAPLVATYFTRIETDGGTVAFANNGWIWNADPLINFAESSSDSYFLREVIIWGDCVKLRYGEDPRDSPWLWDYMTKYTQQMASIFHAFRIDNCHSAPINVAEYLLGKAREIQPELYVCAELFTGSSERDMQFITALGLNSLIREAMAAWSLEDLGRHTVEYGGQPLGSLSSSPEYLISSDRVDYLAASRPHALFADCTHDNETPSQRRTAIDALPNAAVVAFSLCGSGSVLGYDQLVPKHINIVKDERKFNPTQLLNGLGPVKSILNQLHAELYEGGYTEIYGNVTQNLITIIRENPKSRQSYFLLSSHAFSKDSPTSNSIIEFEGYKVSVILSAYLRLTDQFYENDKEFKGLPACLKLTENVLMDEIGWIETFVREDGVLQTKLHLEHFMPGSIIILHRTLDSPSSMIEQTLDEATITKEVKEAASSLSLSDLNILLYRCDEEERDSISRRFSCNVLISL